MSDERRNRSFLRRERAPRSDRPRSGTPPESPETARDDGTALPPRGRERARIVVPRQERGAPPGADFDIELREVRYGTTARGPYLRVVPSKRAFVPQGPGHIEATRLSSQPLGPIERLVAAIKRVVLGSPFATARLAHERLSKLKALAVFSSDALSSSAYATEEILLVLVLAGSATLHDALPIGLVIAALLTIVTLSYRQTIKAYPSGGGAYIVAHENLGQTPGLIAAAALLTDYVLTVSVSVAAGVAAVTSAVPGLLDFRVLIGLFVVGLIMVGNLRGVRESGSIFAAPTYLFILSMSTVIVVGLVKVIIGEAPGTLFHGAPVRPIPGTHALTIFLILRAFSSGSTALTGVEAISNGVPAFKPPESSNARTTLTAMAIILGFLFLGVTFLSSRFGLVPDPQQQETIVSQLGKEVLGKNVLYYTYQVATALVLFLAANTSYADFPRLSAILSRDKYLPRQFSFRGDKLAFSNGIIALSILAAALLVIFGGKVNNLIPLYAVGVFVSFTLSQSGMVKHWLRLRERGWRTSMLINAVGMVGTAIVAVIIAATKFASGAWISILVMLLLMALFILIHRHYVSFARRIAIDERELPVAVPRAVPMQPGGPREHVVVPVDDITKITAAAIRMAREISSMVTAVHLTDDEREAEKFRGRWQKAVPDVPLLIVESPYRAFVAPLVAYIESLVVTEHDRHIVVILPSFVPHHWWERILHNRDVVRVKPFLDRLPDVQVVDFPYDIEAGATPRSPRGGRPVRVRP